MNVLERTQYQAALAVSGAWKGTNRYKIYEELGWESLDQRRFFRRLTQFYKIMNNLTPEYLKSSDSTIAAPSIWLSIFKCPQTHILQN